MASTTVRIPYPRRRWPVFAIGVRRGRVPAAHVPLELLRGRALVPGGRPLPGVLDEDLGAGRPRIRVLRHLLRLAPREPLRDPPAGADDRGADARAGDRRAFQGERRAVPPLGDPARSRAPVDLRRPRRRRALAGVPALAVLRRDRVREPRPGVRPRPRVLRLHASLAEVPAELALRRARRRHGDLGDRALPAGRDPTAGGRPSRQGGPAGAGASLRAPGADPAREGVGLLPGSLRPPHVGSGRGPRGVVHRRQRAASGAHVPRDRGGHLRGDVLRERPLSGLEPADHRRRSVAHRVDPAGDGLPGVHPDVPRQAQRAAVREGLHRAEHRGDAACVRPRGRSVSRSVRSNRS